MKLAKKYECIEKKDLGNGKTRDQTAHAQAQAQASLEMARATCMKAQILPDMVAQ